ncbi:MAG: cysteine peptidase family C39 domain-containing protein [Deltaproteobacteria bacterium]
MTPNSRGRLALPCLIAWLVAGCTAARELALPNAQQTTDFTCGAAVLQAVLADYGEETSEMDLARELGATPEDGVPPEAIVRVAGAHHLRAELKQGLAVDDLRRAVARGIPVLLALQAWPDAPRTRFADDWDDGHYVVVVAVEHDRIVFEDPSLLGSRGVLTRAELEDRWHDADGGRRNVHLGILFSGKGPAPPPLRRHID